MSTKNTSLSSQDLVSSRSVGSGHAVLEIFSDTLRPQLGKTETRRSVSKHSRKKRSKKAPRALPGVVGFKSGFSSLKLPKAVGRSSQQPLRPRRLSKRKNGPRPSSGQLKPNDKTGEGDYLGRPGTIDQARSDSTSKGAQSIKDCHLENVIRSAKLCLSQLRDANDSLSVLVVKDEKLARGIKTKKPTEDQIQLSKVTLNITHLCREAFIPAHRLNQTAIALHKAEDFLRSSVDPPKQNSKSKKSKILLPDIAFNFTTVRKFRRVVSLAAGLYNNFKGDGKLGKDLQEILFCLLTGCQHFYRVVLDCQELFKALLYAGEEEQSNLKEYLISLSAMERSELLVEIQDLRRMIDEIVIFLEKLSWASFTIYRLAGGENLSSASPPTPSNDDKVPVRQSTSTIPATSAEPVLEQKLKKKKKKVKIGQENAVKESDQSNLNAK